MESVTGPNATHPAKAAHAARRHVGSDKSTLRAVNPALSEKKRAMIVFAAIE
jgi:hypothetical protein